MTRRRRNVSAPAAREHSTEHTRAQLTHIGTHKHSSKAHRHMHTHSYTHICPCAEMAPGAAQDGADRARVAAGRRKKAWDGGPTRPQADQAGQLGLFFFERGWRGENRREGGAIRALVRHEQKRRASTANTARPFFFFPDRRSTSGDQARSGHGNARGKERWTRGRQMCKGVKKEEKAAGGDRSKLGRHYSRGFGSRRPVSLPAFLFWRSYASRKQARCWAKGGGSPTGTFDARHASRSFLRPGSPLGGNKPR